MTDEMPRALREGLSKARRTTWQVRAGGVTFHILHLTDRGFVVDARDAPALPGRVDLYDGARHAFQCLVVAGDTEDGETTFEFKRRSPHRDTPPKDFARTPIAFLTPTR